MHKLEIIEKNKVFEFPEDLSECDTVQYINVSNLLYQFNKGKLDYTTFRIQATALLLLEKPITKEKEGDDAKYQNIANIAEVLDSFFELDTEDKPIIKQYYIHNPIDEIKVMDNLKIKTFLGPSDEFDNVYFGEYVEALGHMYDYLDTKDDQFLYLLMATFYREKQGLLNRKGQFSKDKRVPYNPDEVSEIAKLLKYQDKGVVYGFFLLFTSFQKYLQTAVIYIQGKEIDLSLLYKDFPTDKKTPKSDIPGLGMKSLQYMIAESGVFGDLEKVRKAKLWEILIRMYDIRKRDFDALLTQKSAS